MEATYKGVSIVVAIAAIANAVFTFTLQSHSTGAGELEALLSAMLWAKALFGIVCGVAAVAAFWRENLRIFVAALAVVTGLMCASSYAGVTDVLMTLACASLAVAAFTTRPRFE